MATVQRITGDVQVTGSISATGGITGQNRSGLDEDAAEVYELPIQDFRVWDAFQTAIATAGTDDLGITAGAFGTGTPYITTGDVKALGTTTRYARTLFTLPPEYVSGADVSFRAAAGMLTTVAGTSAVIDFEAYKSDRDSTIGGSDLVTTVATTINSLTFGEKTFTVNASGLNAGDVLDIRVTITVVDAGTGTAVIGAIAHAEVLLDIKG